jgi:hypothetical protein
MIKRLIVGLFLGAVIGAVIAAVLVQGFDVKTFDASSFGAAGAYLAAAVTGLVTGLVAGKPVWSPDGKIEAGLKGFFGALIALGGMFVLRQWVHVNVDLSALKASDGGAEIGHLPAASLPLIAAVLAAFFELDNTGSGAQAEGKGSASDKSGEKNDKVRVGGGEEAEESVEDEEEEAPPAKKRR